MFTSSEERFSKYFFALINCCSLYNSSEPSRLRMNKSNAISAVRLKYKALEPSFII